MSTTTFKVFQGATFPHFTKSEQRKRWERIAKINKDSPGFFDEAIKELEKQPWAKNRLVFGKPEPNWRMWEIGRAMEAIQWRDGFVWMDGWEVQKTTGEFEAHLQKKEKQRIEDILSRGPIGRGTELSVRLLLSFTTLWH